VARGTVFFRAGTGGNASVVYAIAKWRDSTGRQQYRRLGRAWMERSDDAADGSGWRKRRGHAPEGISTVAPQSASSTS
jgi:hypothetical protein